MADPQFPVPPSTAAASALAMLRERFRASSVNTLLAFEALAGQLARAPEALAVVETLRRELHRVHGTAGSYGFMAASRLAAALEERAVRWAADATLDRGQRAAMVEHFVRALRLSFADDVPIETPEAVDLSVLVHREDVPRVNEAPTRTMPTGESTAPAGIAHGWGDDAAAGRQRLALVGLAPEQVATLRTEATMHGFSVTAVSDAGDARLMRRLHALVPHVVVAPARRAAALATAGFQVVSLGAAAASSGRGGTIVVLPAASEPGAVLDAVARLALAGAWAGSSVLVVDDDPAILEIARAVLAGDGVRVETLDDASRLEEAIERIAPSLLLIDVQMRDANGIALTAALRMTDAGRELPIIVFSSESHAEMRRRAYEAGADEFIAKPIVPAELYGRITDRLERRRLRLLADGRHPATALPLPLRSATDAPAALAAAHGAREPASLVLVRGEGIEGLGAAAWRQECIRLAAACIGAPFIGHRDDATLVIVLDDDAATAEERMRALIPGAAPDETTAARAAGLPVISWRAGIADAEGVKSRDYAALEAAAGAMLVADGDLSRSRVRRWTLDRSRAAPDVVIVEDDVALSDMLQYALGSAGFSYRAFRTGPEALDALLKMEAPGRRPVVLLDVDLPGMDGHSLHERLRTERPGVFGVVFTTVHSGEGEQIRALECGALDWVTKPLSLRVLMAKVPHWLGAPAPGAEP